MSRIDQYIKADLSQLEEKGLKRELRQVESSQGPTILVENTELLNFCSNNYLGLADDSRLKNAAIEAITTQGFGSGASRLVCGNMSAYRKLEQRLAEFKGCEECLIFNTGYMANVGIISSLFGRDDLILCDRLNHASIIDGILLSRASYKRYAHCDMGSLEKLLGESTGFKKRAIITDSVFSMDGDIAPLDSIVRLARKYDCLVMIDEAHAFGVMGEKGKGLAEHFEVERQIDVQMGTLSKAAGSFGAYVAASKELKDFFINKARSFIYTTGMPPSVAAASLKAVEIIQAEPELRSRLWMNTNYVRGSLARMGFDMMQSETPIIPVLVKDPKTTMKFSQQLFKEGIYASAIRPPTVSPRTSRLRLTVTAQHSQAQCDRLLSAMQKTGKQLCLI